MPHYPVPSQRYSDIFSIRLSTRPALTLHIPAAQVPEPPRPQYDTMRSYQRLEKAGTIASMESQQQNVRPLFAYPRKEFETPWRKVSRKATQKKEEENEGEDMLPFLSSSLIDTSDLLDSIFSSSPEMNETFPSSPPTSLDFSSSLPYPSERPSEQKIWGRDPPPVQLSARKKDSLNSTPSSRHISIDSQEYNLAMSSTPPYHSDQYPWRSSPPIAPARRHSRQDRHSKVHRRSHLQSSPQTLPYTILREDPSNTPRKSSINFQDFASRHRQRRSSQRMIPSPAMRYVTVLEDISEDEQPAMESVEVRSQRTSRRSKLGLKIDRAVAWVLRR